MDAEWQISEEDEGSDTTDFGLLNEEKQAALAAQPSNEPSDTDGCTHCEVYTMTFGGMTAYTATPSIKVDDSGKLDNEEEDTVDLKQPDQDVDVDVLLASKAGDTPYEVYTMNFGGLYTFAATATSDDASELEEQPNQTEEPPLEREESSLRDSDPAEGKIDKQPEPTTPYEVYTVSFGGLHTFTATPVSDGAGGEIFKVNKDCSQTMDGHDICTPYEVHTVTFGGLYTFTATLHPIQCDGAPPMHAA